MKKTILASIVMFVALSVSANDKQSGMSGMDGMSGMSGMEGMEGKKQK
jgi:hypothetical protein